MFALQDKNTDRSDFETGGTIRQFVIEAPTLPADAEGQAVKELFESEPEAEGIVVFESSRPVGIIMRTEFYQKMGTLYGHSLYMKRPIRILMEPAIMSADAGDSISKVGIQAMSREESKLYDYIVVYENRNYVGVVSIRLFLVELSQRNEAQISVLKSQQKKLLSAHEKEIELRKNLEYQSAAVSNLLDHADQGFLWFGSDLIIKKEYSYKCTEIFDGNIGGECYTDLISEYFSRDKISVFKAAFDSFFKNNSPVTDNVYLMLLPSDCRIAEKNIHFEYRRIENDGVKAVMVIMNDITEKINLEKAMEDDRNRQRLLIKAFGYQAQIKQMLDEFHEMFSGGYKNFFSEGASFQKSLEELFRAVHTFKGDFAQYGFICASTQLHVFEEQLLSVINQPEGAWIQDVERIMDKIDAKRVLKDDLEIIYEVLGKAYFDQSEIIPVPKSKLDELEKRIRSGSDPLDKTAVIGLIETLRMKNVKVFLNQYQDYLQYLSGRVLKRMPVYIVEGDDIEIDGDRYGDFFKSLVHIFRNIMDHGLETEEERLKCGKPEKGLVECEIARLDDGWFSIRISDDGKGINLSGLRAKAIENHLYTAEELDQMTENEIADLVFADRLSTKNTSDTLSGRGVGMPAFREACLKLNGKIEIITKEKQGTAFVITLPCGIAQNEG